MSLKLISFAYLQIGMVQAVSGFYSYFVVLNDYGFPPSILPGLGSTFESKYLSTGANGDLFLSTIKGDLRKLGVSAAARLKSFQQPTDASARPITEMQHPEQRVPQPRGGA